MPVVATMNYKGGVGKTTVTANLAAELAYRGKDVLLVDLDPQASLTFSFVTPDEWHENLQETRTIKSWFDAHDEGLPPPPDLEDLVIRPRRVNERIRGLDAKGSVDLVASHLGLINVDLDLATRLGGATRVQQARNYLRVHGSLRRGVEQLEGNYDVVLMDCPPNFNIVTKNAIAACERVLVPAKPDYLSTLGIQYLERNLAELIADFNRYAEEGDGVPINPEIMGVVFTMIHPRSGKPIKAQSQYIGQIDALGVPTMEARIRINNTQHANAPEEGVPVVLGGSGAPMREFEELVTEFVEKLGQ